MICWEFTTEILFCYVYSVDNIPSAIKAKCDACFTFPCANGAVCSALPNRDYQCSCSGAATGNSSVQIQLFVTFQMSTKITSHTYLPISIL